MNLNMGFRLSGTGATGEPAPVVPPPAQVVFEIDAPVRVGFGTDWFSEGGTITPSAGTDRMLVVAVGEEGNDSEPQSVTFGDQALTQALLEDSEPGFSASASIWTLNDAGIVAAIGNDVTAVSNAVATTAGVMWAFVLEGVDQTTPVAFTGADSVLTGQLSGTGAVDTAGGSRAYAVAHYNAAVPGGATMTWSGITERDTSASGFFNATLASRETTGAAINVNVTHADDTSDQDSALALVVFNPA